LPKKELIRLYAKIVVDFAKLEPVGEKCHKHLVNINRLIGFRTEDLEWIFGGSNETAKWVEESVIEVRDILRNMLEQIVRGESLRKVLFDDDPSDIGYVMSSLTIDDDDILVEVPPIDVTMYMLEKDQLLLDVTYCLIQFLKYEDRRKVRRCDECGEFYISKTLRESKFCSDPCRFRSYNRERIKSGKAKEYKRRRYQEGHK
jgi:hypothetical protein